MRNRLWAGVIGRHVGLSLEALRFGAGMSSRQAGDALHVSDSTLWRIERGLLARLRMTEELCTAYGASPKVRAASVALTELLNSTRAESRWVPDHDAVPPELGVHAAVVGRAVRQWRYEPATVPELLRTRAYGQVQMRGVSKVTA
jgi:transcriptional regulator with XRE-family HTH domain